MELLQSIMIKLIAGYLIIGILISFGRFLFWRLVLIKRKLAKKYQNIGSLPLIYHPIILLLWPREYVRNYKKDLNEEKNPLSCLPIVPFLPSLFYLTNSSRVNDALIHGYTEFIYYRKELAFIFDRDYREFDPKEFYRKQIAYGLIFIFINPMLFVFWLPISVLIYSKLLYISFTELISFDDEAEEDEDYLL